MAQFGARSLCTTYDWACAFPGRSNEPDLRIAGSERHRINPATRVTSDKTRADCWISRSRRGGDCEALALLNCRKLIAPGYALETLQLKTVLDHSKNSHAVLVTRTGAGDIVIDDLNNRMRPACATDLGPRS